jgi:hypothetical protein
MLTGKKPNMITGFLIEPLEEKISEVELDAGDIWASLKETLGHIELTTMSVPGGDDVFICDDIALLRENPDQFGYFQPSFRDYPLCNKALIFGLNQQTGDFRSCTIPLFWLKEHISFPKVRYLGTTSVQTQTKHPIFGEMFQVVNIPQFVEIKKEDMN